MISPPWKHGIWIWVFWKRAMDELDGWELGMEQTVISLLIFGIYHDGVSLARSHAMEHGAGATDPSL